MSGWQAQVLVAGEADGEGLLLTEPLSLWGGLDPETGRIIDQRHPQCGERVTGKIMVLPSGRGSSSASSILLEAVRQKTAPAGIITASADGILALGAVVAQEIYGQAPAVVVLAPADYAALSQRLAAESCQLQISRAGLVQLQ
ncbi:MAG: DUF126 domain-containing protein [Anaerolineales bacterium]|nr:DUF126 domain-containing protein [Anaerolineales bacterium]